MWKLLAILLLAMLLRLIVINYHVHDPLFSIQQDNYADYAKALKNSTLGNNPDSYADTRLFPGYPWLILLISLIVKSEIISGVIINMSAALISIYLFWLLTKNLTVTAVFAIFPPIWVNQSTKVATEPLVLMLLLLSFILFLRKYYLYAGLLIGFAFTIRIIAICLLAALIWHLFSKKEYKKILTISVGFFLTASFLLIYNYFIFDKSLFYQFIVNIPMGKASFGAMQIFLDIFRLVNKGLYRILASGMFYLFINFFALILLYRKRRKSQIFKIAFLWMLFSMLFIFSIGPTPLFEEFLRFTVPFTPALILGLLKINLKQNLYKHT